MKREIADRITIDPAVIIGKPVIKGTRMPVELVLASFPEPYREFYVLTP